MIHMKKLSIYLFVFTLLFTALPNVSSAKPSLSAASSILMEQKSGRVLYEDDAHEIRRIASITKIMTAIIAIESGKLHEKVKMSERAVNTEGSSIYLKEGTEMKLEDLLYGLMLRSGNDAAVAIAEHVGGSVEGFVLLMNQKAEQLGMENTSFANPHGLDDHEDHYSTAYDMALLTKYAMENEKFRVISGTKVHKVVHPDPDSQWDIEWRNKNRLLTDKYPYCTGGKTGYTKRANRTLVTTATKGSLDLIAVTLDAPNDWEDHINMYEYGFSTYKQVNIAKKGIKKFIKTEPYRHKVFIKNDIDYPLTKKEKKHIRIEYQLLKPKKEWKDKENIPEVVGQMVVYLQDKPIKTVPLYYSDEKKEKKRFLHIFQSNFSGHLGVKQHG